MALPSEHLHDVLAFASLCIGESPTVVSECACLGTPSIYVSSRKLGYITEEEHKYGLVFDLAGEEDILKRSMEILGQKDASKWQAGRERLLGDKIDVTGWMLGVLESFEKKPL